MDTLNRRKLGDVVTRGDSMSFITSDGVNLQVPNVEHTVSRHSLELAIDAHAQGIDRCG